MNPKPAPLSLDQRQVIPMTLKIKSEAEYEAAVAAVESLWDAKEGTRDHQLLTALTSMIHDYEGISSLDIMALS